MTGCATSTDSSKASPHRFGQELQEGGRRAALRYFRFRLVSLCVTIEMSAEAPKKADHCHVMDRCPASKAAASPAPNAQGSTWPPPLTLSASAQTMATMIHAQNTAPT